MTTFKNTNFIKRNYETTNLVFAVSTQAPGANWVECDNDELELSGCDQLQTDYANGVRTTYFGWL